MLVCLISVLSYAVKRFPVANIVHEHHSVNTPVPGTPKTPEPFRAGDIEQVNSERPIVYLHDLANEINSDGHQRHRCKWITLQAAYHRFLAYHRLAVDKQFDGHV